MAGEQKTEFKFSIFDEAKLALRGKVEGATGNATLKVGIWNNQPRITIWTGVEGDPNKGMLIAKLDAPSFATFLQQAQMVIDDNDFKKFGVYNKSHPKDGEGKLNYKEYKIDSLLQIAKDEDGRFFIGVTDKTITPVKFYFEPTNYHNFVYNGKELTTSEVSKVYAKGWLSLIFKLFPVVLHDNFVPYKKQQANTRDTAAFTETATFDGIDEDITW